MIFVDKKTTTWRLFMSDDSPMTVDFLQDVTDTDPDFL